MHCQPSKYEHLYLNSLTWFTFDFNKLKKKNCFFFKLWTSLYNRWIPPRPECTEKTFFIFLPVHKMATLFHTLFRPLVGVFFRSIVCVESNTEGDVCVTFQRNLFNKQQPVLSWIFLLNIIYEFLSLQVRSPTSALGRAVNGVLQGAMSLHVIIANTQVPNPSSAAIVIAASHVLIIWPCTWNDTCEVKFKSKKGLKINCVPLRAIKCRGRSSQLV